MKNSKEVPSDFMGEFAQRGEPRKVVQDYREEPGSHELTFQELQARNTQDALQLADVQEELRQMGMK